MKYGLVDRVGDLERVPGANGGGTTGDLASATSGVYAGGVPNSDGTGGSLGASMGTDGSLGAKTVPGAETVAGASKLVAVLPPIFWVGTTWSGSIQCQMAVRCGLLARQFGHGAEDLTLPVCRWYCSQQWAWKQ